MAKNSVFFGKNSENTPHSKDGYFCLQPSLWCWILAAHLMKRFLCKDS